MVFSITARVRGVVGASRIIALGNLLITGLTFTVFQLDKRLILKKTLISTAAVLALTSMIFRILDRFFIVCEADLYILMLYVSQSVYPLTLIN